MPRRLSETPNSLSRPDNQSESPGLSNSPSKMKSQTQQPENSNCEQGWTQRTDRGRMYLSRREQNVFVLEGTSNAGVSAACTYRGNRKEQEIQQSKVFSLFCELKADGNPGEIYVLLDVVDLSDLSSGCDFLSIKLATNTRELRIENRRKKHRDCETVFVLPNCSMLRPNSYITLKLDVAHDTLCALSLNGVNLVKNLNLGRRSSQSNQSSLASQCGVATYGKSRAYLRRFRFEHFTEPLSNRNDAPISMANNNSESNQLQIVPLSQQNLSPSRQQNANGSHVNYANAINPPSYGLTNQTQQQATVGVINSNNWSSNNSSGNQQQQTQSSDITSGMLAPIYGNLGGVSNAITQELELAQLIEREVILQQGQFGPSENNVSFDDIGGLDQAKTALNEAVVLPLLLPEMFTGIRRPWKGVLLFGPPGTGKTMLAKAVASSATAGNSVTFFNCSASTLTSKWRGESEKLLKTLFSMARMKYPSILFFDEIDSLLSTRGSKEEHEASRRFKSEFLIHMDGLLSDPSRTPLVLCTSNTPWDLDDALRRRLEKRIYVPFPDHSARKFFFERNMSGSDLDKFFDPEALARATNGYTGSDIKAICREASMAPLRRGLSGLTPLEIKELRDNGGLKKSNTMITMQDFYDALVVMTPSVSQAEVGKYEKWTEEFGIRQVQRESESDLQNV